MSSSISHAITRCGLLDSSYGVSRQTTIRCISRAHNSSSSSSSSQSLKSHLISLPCVRARRCSWVWELYALSMPMRRGRGCRPPLCSLNERQEGRSELEPLPCVRVGSPRVRLNAIIRGWLDHTRGRDLISIFCFCASVEVNVCIPRLDILHLARHAHRSLKLRRGGI